MAVRGSDEPDLQRPHARDLALQQVAADDRGDAFRSAAEDQVPRLQRPRRRQVLDRLGDVPDELADRALLAELAVDLERDARVGVDAAVGGAADRADRRRMVEALADVPRPAELLRLALQVAARHVEA